MSSPLPFPSSLHSPNVNTTLQLFDINNTQIHTTTNNKDKQRNTQLVATQNFLWGADQAMCNQQDIQGHKMLIKAKTILERMSSPPIPLVEEINARLLLIQERALILPQLVSSISSSMAPIVIHQEQNHNNYYYGDEIISTSTFDHNLCFVLVRGNSKFVQCIVEEIRKDIFCDELHIPPEMEIDERDGLPTTFHLVVTKGDAIIGSIRWYCDETINHYYAQIDRCFVIKEYRKQGLAKIMLERVKSEALSRGITQLGILIRCELPGGQEILSRVRKLTNQTPIEQVGSSNVLVLLWI
jgi:GNAT superfamily N-acetyltransferase